jgi:hypothetical protein
MDYKLYSLDETGHIVSARDVHVGGDLAALREAEMACGKNAIEVWQGARRVGHVNLGNTLLSHSDRMSL